MPRELKHLQTLLQFWTPLFAVGGITFFLFPGLVVEVLNSTAKFFPFLNPLQMTSSPFWSVLAVSLMAILTFVSAMAAGKIEDAKPLILGILISKATSTLGFMGYFVKAGHTAPMFWGILCDGSIFLITFYFFQKASPYFSKKSAA
jgi:hypothetical protein